MEDIANKQEVMSLSLVYRKYPSYKIRINKVNTLKT